GVIRVAYRGIDQLDEARRRPDRGGNPWWKGIGLMVGLAAIFTNLTLCQMSPHLCPDWLRVLLAVLSLAGAIAVLLCRPVPEPDSRHGQRVVGGVSLDAVHQERPSA
ncbi:MAG: hypothetical protein LC799_03390, partial [Actinobacteria bacterium]|nr:hypothetical protein [Actinomycetota bacterium]